MLLNLHIKNVALIEEIDIHFSSGLNILSGETGAGKSMIIDSINFVLGEKISKDFIRNGEELAIVEAIFEINQKHQAEIFSEMGIDIDENNQLLISRQINNQGKSHCRINGRSATVGILKELSSVLVDMHGQHEHQSLLNANKHIELLDRFCGENLDERKRELSLLYKKYKNILKEMKQLTGNEADRERTIDLLNFQTTEISTAKLLIGEDESLMERKKVLNSSEKLIKISQETILLLSAESSYDSSIMDRMKKVSRNTSDMARIDSSLESLTQEINEIEGLFSEFSHKLSVYCESLDYEPNELNKIEERLDLIYKLKKKYGATVKEVLDYYDKISIQLNNIKNSEEILKKLEQQKKYLEKEIEAVCLTITQERTLYSNKIQTQIETILSELGMKNAKFAINIEQKEEFTQNGIDKVEFLISPNVGEPLKQLSKIASGGEMSRVMLALKTVLADVDNIDTFIFDEIDTGVSGRTAQQVGEKLSFIAKKHQLLCITHLPQIASMADKHFLIEKKSVKDKTVTEIFELDNDKIILEIARLLGGAKITASTLNTAKEIKEMAINIKLTS